LEDGIVVTDFAKIKAVARTHFVYLHMQREEADHSNITTMLEHIPTKITNEEISNLNRPISEVEIFAAIWSLESDLKRILGFNSTFIKWVASCIGNPWISPLVNGIPS
jgi:hypothetical protein